MRIVVCVTRTVDPDARLAPGSGVEPALEAGVRYVMSTADASALEQALRVRDADPSTEVIALTMGTVDCASVLRDAIGLGVDDALLVWDERLRDSDSMATAQVLASTARWLGADLVLCGHRAPDGSTGQVGGHMAALMDVPVVTRVVALEIADGEARAERRLDRGLRCAVRCALPAVVTVEEGAARPRYPRLRDRLRATRQQIEPRGIDGLGLSDDAIGRAGSRTEVVGLSRPKPTTVGIFVPDAELSPEEQFEQLMSGGASQGAARAGSAPASDADNVEQVVTFLTDRGHI